MAQDDSLVKSSVPGPEGSTARVSVDPAQPKEGTTGEASQIVEVTFGCDPVSRVAHEKRDPKNMNVSAQETVAQDGKAGRLSVSAEASGSSAPGSSGLASSDANKVDPVKPVSKLSGNADAEDDVLVFGASGPSLVESEAAQPEPAESVEVVEVADVAIVDVDDVTDVEGIRRTSDRRLNRRKRGSAAVSDAVVLDVDEFPEPDVAHASRKRSIDVDDEIEVVGEAPRRMRNGGLRVTDVDAETIPVEAFESGSKDITSAQAPKRKRLSRPSNCSACQKALNVPAPGSTENSTRTSPDPHLFVSRCQHTLCHACGIEAVAVNVSDTGDASKPPQAAEAKSIPSCPAQKCRAPLSPEEARLALVPGAVDAMFSDALDDFNEWMQFGATALATEPVALPPFSEEMAQSALCVEGSDALGEWFTDDVLGAYGPLWLYETGAQGDPDLKSSSEPGQKSSSENKTVANGGAGDEDDDDDDVIDLGSTEKVDDPMQSTVVDWICAACGLSKDCVGPDARSAQAPVSSESRPKADSSNPPLFLHCAYARAFGVSKAIEGFVETTSSAERVSAAAETSSAPSKPKRQRKSKYASAAHARKNSKTRGFAKGTGYGGNNSTDWKGLSKQFLDKVARTDAAMAYWLFRIRAFLLVGGDGSPSNWPFFMRQLLRNLNLVTHICKILVSESIMDVGERVIVYVAALRVVNALVDIPSLRPLVTEPVEAAQGRSVVSLVSSIGHQAVLFSTGAGAANLDIKTTLLIRQTRRCMRAIKRHNLLPEGPAHSGAAKETVLDLDNDVDLDTLMGRGDAEGGQGSSIPAHTDLSTAPTSEEKDLYMNEIRGLQFATVPNLALSSVFFNNASIGENAGVGRGATMRRIASEVASLSASLPLSWSSTIFLRVDEDRYDFLQAMITGPDGSPYSCGCFVFDIFLPPNYPNSPPKFRLLTTGGGRVRFNPNLYDCGKVCLSLLGTWSGPSWTPASTLLQVLVSIQSLILVDDPYFNEPGFESSMGTPAGKRESDRYNAGVRRDNVVSAMIANLRHPHPALADAIRAHFRYKGRAVRMLIEEWFPQTSNAASGPAGAPPEVAAPASLSTATSLSYFAANLPNVALATTVNGFFTTSAPNTVGVGKQLTSAERQALFYELDKLSN